MANIFVGNLAFEVTENDLRGEFAQYGNVEKVNLIRDRDTGQSRGIAFVEMSNSADAANAINALNGQKLGGRVINVDKARPRPGREEGSRYEQRSNRGGNRW
jgi:RNA recognition motif-containing protein